MNLKLNDSQRLDYLMKRCQRAAKSLSDLASLTENPSTKRLIQTLAEAINQYDRDTLDATIENEELQANPPLINPQQHDGI